MLKFELVVLNRLIDIAGRGLLKRFPSQEIVITLLAVTRASHRAYN